jgi:hypothetical protein
MLIDGRAISARYFETRLGESEMREIFHVRAVLAGITIGRGRLIDPGVCPASRKTTRD